MGRIEVNSEISPVVMYRFLAPSGLTGFSRISVLLPRNPVFLKLKYHKNLKWKIEHGTHTFFPKRFRRSFFLRGELSMGPVRDFLFRSFKNGYRDKITENTFETLAVF